MAVKVKYIDNDPKRGILYDWKKIRKKYKSLGIPDGYFDPLKVNPERAGYYWALSDRSRGKTTQCLLLGMVMHELYDTVIQYVRNERDMVAPKALADLFDVIQDKEFDYIPKITGGRWNSCFYYGGRWYYCQRDDEGNVIEKCPGHFAFCTSLDDVDKLKSSYNAPRGDLIIFDEFIKVSGYNYNDFIRFADIESTIYRKRISGITYMLSNTIDINSPWIDEFEIRAEIETMEKGDAQYFVTDDGTHIFVELLRDDTSEAKKEFNRRFFGFSNPKLAAITGKGTWACEHYPHIPQLREDEEEDHRPRILYQKLYVRQSNKLIRLMLVKNETVGLCVYVHPATRTYRDSTILTTDELTDPREIFGFGPADDPRLKLIWRLYAANRFYYAHNSEGALLRAYIKAVKDSNRRRLL